MIPPRPGARSAPNPDIISAADGIPALTPRPKRSRTQRLNDIWTAKIATLVAAIVKVLLVVVVIGAAWPPPALQDIFFWMRAGWGLLGPLALALTAVALKVLPFLPKSLADGDVESAAA